MLTSSQRSQLQTQHVRFVFPARGLWEDTTAHQQPYSLGTPSVLSWESYINSGLVTGGWEEAIYFVAFLATFLENQGGCVSRPPLEESSGLYHPGSKAACLPVCI